MNNNFINMNRYITNLQTEFSLLSFNRNNSKTQSHDDYELYFLVRGNRMFFSEKCFCRLKKGDLLLIKPGATHAFLDDEPSEYARLAININPKFLNPLLGKEFEERAKASDDVILVRAPELYDSIIEELKIITENRSTTDEKFTFLTLSFIAKLIHHLLNCNNIVLTPTNAEFKNDKKMSDILKYITLNYSKQLTVRHIASKFFISECHLSRTFKKYLGMGIAEYINHLKIERARNLLQSSTAKKINIIAKECGFNTVSHFNHVFTKEVGMTPSKYRMKKSK